MGSQTRQRGARRVLPPSGEEEDIPAKSNAAWQRGDTKMTNYQELSIPEQCLALSQDEGAL